MFADVFQDVRSCSAVDFHAHCTMLSAVHLLLFTFAITVLRSCCSSLHWVAVSIGAAKFTCSLASDLSSRSSYSPTDSRTSKRGASPFLDNQVQVSYVSPCLYRQRLLVVCHSIYFAIEPGEVQSQMSAPPAYGGSRHHSYARPAALEKYQGARRRCSEAEERLVGQ